MLILLILYLAALAVQLAYGFFFRPARYRTVGSPDHWPGVSILICARNESGNLQKHLPFILEQHYPGPWEVLVVNDRSTDATASCLNALQTASPRLRVVANSESTMAALPGKKSALDRGMRSAQYDWLLLTDADCRPVSNRWLETMTRQAVSGRQDMILGYGAYARKPGWLNRFIRWETLHTAMLYFSFARAGRAYMGVGRNLFLRKALYTEAIDDVEFRKVYSSLPSGDDDLLINYVRSRKHAIGTCSHPEGMTLSRPPAGFGPWIRQKRRHVSTGKLYPGPLKAWLAIYAFSHALFWLGWLALTVSALRGASAIPEYWLAGAWLAGVFRILFYAFLHRQWARKLEGSPRPPAELSGDFLWLAYNMLLSPFIFFRNRKQWK